MHLLRWDLVAHSVGSRAAALWNLVLPSVVIGVYLLAFDLTPGFRFAGRDTPGSYGLHLVVGLVPWLCFQEGITRSANAFVDQRHLITQIPIPPLLFPLATVGSALVRHAVSVVILVAILLLSGVRPDRAWVALPLATFCLVLLTVGGALVVAALTVWQRDVAPLASGLMLPWFFATPVIYPTWLVPPPLRLLLDLNPVSGVVLAYRDALVLGRAPPWDGLLYAAVVGTLVLLLGLSLVARLAPDLPERL